MAQSNGASINSISEWRSRKKRSARPKTTTTTPPQVPNHLPMSKVPLLAAPISMGAAADDSHSLAHFYEDEETGVVKKGGWESSNNGSAAHAYRNGGANAPFRNWSNLKRSRRPAKTMNYHSLSGNEFSDTFSDTDKNVELNTMMLGVDRSNPILKKLHNKRTAIQKGTSLLLDKRKRFRRDNSSSYTSSTRSCHSESTQIENHNVTDTTAVESGSDFVSAIEKDEIEIGSELDNGSEFESESGIQSSVQFRDRSANIRDTDTNSVSDDSDSDSDSSGSDDYSVSGSEVDSESGSETGSDSDIYSDSDSDSESSSFSGGHSDYDSDSDSSRSSVSSDRESDTFTIQSVTILIEESISDLSQQMKTLDRLKGQSTADELPSIGELSDVELNREEDEYKFDHIFFPGCATSSPSFDESNTDSASIFPMNLTSEESKSGFSMLYNKGAKMGYSVFPMNWTSQADSFIGTGMSNFFVPPEESNSKSEERTRMPLIGASNFAIVSFSRSQDNEDLIEGTEIIRFFVQRSGELERKMAEESKENFGSESLSVTEADSKSSSKRIMEFANFIRTQLLW